MTEQTPAEALIGDSELTPYGRLLVSVICGHCPEVEAAVAECVFRGRGVRETAAAMRVPRSTVQDWVTKFRAALQAAVQHPDYDAEMLVRRVAVPEGSGRVERPPDDPRR